ncbi:MAG: sulfatase-like hydrolase/transferase [Luteolibacter sp.]
MKSNHFTHLLLSAAFTCCTTNAATRPNVIVIISDDAGYADFGFMSGLSGKTSEVPTPNLDALAKRGVTFSRAYVAANCQPTRAAIVTGAYQQRIGNESVGNDHILAEQVFEGVPVETDTVWDRMKSLGYTTGAIGKWHLGQTEDTPEKLGNRPQNQGVDEFYGMWHGSRDFLVGTYNKNGAKNPEHALQPRFIREAIIHPDGSKTDTIVEFTKFADVPDAPKYITNIFGDYAEQFVADHYDDPEPFFLYVAHPAPHKPWTDESPHYDDPRVSSITPENRRQVASMMLTMDTEIGELMAKLDDPNGDGNKADSITDNTLVIFLNDNGGVAGKDKDSGINGTDNGKLKGFKGSSYDGGIRVPMILAGAGLDPSKRGTVYHHPVHGIDILPTSVALAGGNLDPLADKIDGVDLLPFLNEKTDAHPHEILVHKWRGSFAVIKGDWKLQNSRNISADPKHYELYRMTDGGKDIDPGEENDLMADPKNAPLVAELKRALTDHEAFFDKPRYAIRSNTLETEPINIFDHHVFRPGVNENWSGDVVIKTKSVTGTKNWYEAGTENEKFLLNTDCFPGAILEFPVSDSNYTANNDYRRKTGMEFMLNKIILSGNHSGTVDHTATIGGLELLFTKDLKGNPPEIAIDGTNSGANGFTFDLTLDLILYDTLTFSGDGNATVMISSPIREHSQPRGLIKQGTSKVSLTGKNTFSGDTTVTAGTLSLGQPNDHNDESTISLAPKDATLDLAFSGTDTIAKLYIGEIQQPAGIYKAIDASGAGTEIPQITGAGKLEVTTGR